MSSLHFPLLRLLADGEFHSMQALGAALGIAPESIRAHAAGLERLGLAITADERGVRLSEPCELIDGAQVCARLQARPTPIAVEITDQCASTNTELMQRARNGAAEHAFALACELQTGGRGRRGKSWRSGIGTDLTFSLLWRFTQGAGALSGLSLAVGVALARALDRAGYPGVQLKWPNDLVLRGRKLGGILIEVAGDSLGPSAVVVGVGINVHWSAARAEGLDQPATGLSAEGDATPSRAELLAAALAELGSALEEFSRCGFAAFRTEWLARHAWQGKQVTLRIAEREVAEGEAMGVDDDGALLLRSDGRVAPFHSGELRLRER